MTNLIIAHCPNSIHLAIVIRFELEINACLVSNFKMLQHSRHLSFPKAALNFQKPPLIFAKRLKVFVSMFD